MSGGALTRREAAARLAALWAASPLLQAQRAPKLRGEPPGRIAPADELVNTHEFEPMARRKLASAVYETVAETPRSGFDRITFRPRMMVNTTALDLTTRLFGRAMFAPIMAGPIAHQKQFHADGESAMAEGASRAKAVMILAGRSDAAVERIAEKAEAGLWGQVYATEDAAAALGRARRMVRAGCAALALTVNPGQESAKQPDWDFFNRIREAVSVPLLLKGVMNLDVARAAVEKGADGIVVSNHGAGAGGAGGEPIAVLPEIVRGLGGETPVLIDGGFRRGSDVLKALALGARAVLVCRPAVWGLAAYGTRGVRTVIELMQTELARDMAMCGTVNVAAVGPQYVRIHRAPR